MKTKKVRPVLVESKFNSIEEMQGDIILRDNKLYTCEQLNALLLHKKESSDKVFELILVSLEDENIENGAVFYDKLDNRVMTWNMSYSFPSEYYEYCYKVITRQSQISPEYISKFIEQYNNSCIEDLEIKMEEIENWGCADCGDIDTFSVHTGIYKPKLTNGFVSIVDKDEIIGKPLEDYIKQKHNQDRCMGFIDGYQARKSEEAIGYTEEEVKTLVNKAIYDTISNPMLITSKSTISDVWFNENKKF